jgi:ribosomal protein S18 acetylase RimI-like enzyme
VAAAADGAKEIGLRRYRDEDFEHVVERWHETNLVSYPYVAEHQKHTLQDARVFFRSHIVPECQIWLAQSSRAIAGMLALEAPWIRHLAVFPEFQRNGIGTALLGAARAGSPGELRLYTFQRNAPARAFYERHGFVAVAFGVSPDPESEPDVEYRWTPAP